MQTKRLWRSLVSYGTAIVLAAQILGSVTPASLVRAATPTLRITEINWAGSPGMPTDEWVELKNVSGAPINFATTPYDLNAVIGGTSQTIASLGASDGILPADFFLVLSREQAGTANSTLFGASPSTMYEQKATLDLPNMPTAYHLMQGTAEEDFIDAPTGGSIPFAGFAGTVNAPATSSMSRVSPTAPGDQQSSWYSARTVGLYFTPTAPTQYGTPGEENVEVPAPQNVSVMPPFSTTTANAPEVSGTVGGPASEVAVTFDRVSYSPIAYSRTYTGAVSGGGFSVTADFPPLDAGRYHISAVARDAAGHQSQTVAVMAASGSSDTEYYVLQVTSSVPAPVLDSFPPITNQLTLPMSGTLDTTGHNYRSIEIMRNGRFLETVSITGTQDSFSTTVSLLPNVSNNFAFIAVDEFGVFSMPAFATIVSDTITPTPVVASLVKVTSNPAGTPDSLLGLGGAAEAYTTVWVYADAALTQFITSVPVISSGGFGPVNLGDNIHDKVWLVVKDAAGNTSTAIMVENPFGFTGTGGATNFTTPKVLAVTDTTAKIGWDNVPGAVFYRLKYKLSGGTYNAPTTLCSGGAACTYETTITGLKPGTMYVVAMAAVDQFGVQGPWSEVSFTTTGKAPVVPAVVHRTTSSSTSSRSTDTVTKTTVTPSPSPSASASASPEQGDVKSATQDNSHNWTPWIILGVLVGIAILATAGYFYWFGGEEAAVGSTAAMESEREAAKPAARRQTTSTRSSDSSPPKRSSKDKRW